MGEGVAELGRGEPGRFLPWKEIFWATSSKQECPELTVPFHHCTSTMTAPKVTKGLCAYLLPNKSMTDFSMGPGIL